MWNLEETCVISLMLVIQPTHWKQCKLEIKDLVWGHYSAIILPRSWANCSTSWGSVLPSVKWGHWDWHNLRSLSSLPGELGARTKPCRQVRWFLMASFWDVSEVDLFSTVFLFLLQVNSEEEEGRQSIGFHFCFIESTHRCFHYWKRILCMSLLCGAIPCPFTM